MKKEKPAYSTLQNIIYVVKTTWNYDKHLFIYFIPFTIFNALIPFLGIFFPKWILEELMNKARTERILLLLVLFFVLSSLDAYITQILHGLSFPHMIRARFVFIKDIQKKCMTTDFQNTEDPKFLNDMDTAFRCLESNDRGIEGILHKMFEVFGNLIALVGYVAIVASLNVFILIYLLLNVLVSYYLTFSVRKYEHSKKDEISDNDRRSKYVYKIMYDFGYGKEIRLFGLGTFFTNLFSELKKKRQNIHKSIKWFGFKIGLVDILLLMLRETVIYAYLIYLVYNNELSIPDFTMYFTTIAGFAVWFTTMFNDMAHIRGQNLDICDYRKFMEKKEHMKNEKTVPVPHAPFEIEFRNVSFKYPGSEKYIYEDLNFKIPYSQKLAIVGHNGAGKTTFVKLLCRLYDVTEGQILLNGIDIREFDREEYFKLFSCVFQEVKTTAFSIAENVANTEKENIDYDRLNLSLEHAGIHEKVNSLKNGVHTGLKKVLDDDGTEFSGGENQKVSIARALYKNGPFMILDEPTAALDAISEYKIYLSFNDMCKDKTAIYISHRLASTHFCDKIAMFEHGKLIEYGTHDELMKKADRYADMFDVQAKYYKEDII